MTSKPAERDNALQAVLRSDAASNFAMNPTPASLLSRRGLSRAFGRPGQAAMLMTSSARAGRNKSSARALLLVARILELFTAPLGAEAQHAGKIYRIGYLQTSTREQQLHMVKAFEDGLRDLGYRAGENVVIEYRFAEAHPERLPGLAADLARRNVDVIVAGINSNTAAAREATPTIPIVMANSVDPVGAGFVASLARPGGNITGVTQDTGDEVFGKRLELLREILPRDSRVWAVLWNPTFAPNQSRWKAAADAARKLGLALLSAEMRGLDDLKPAFASITKKRAGGLVVMSDAVLFTYRHQIGSIAIKNRLPSLSTVSEYSEAGLLLTSGASLPGLWYPSATYVEDSQGEQTRPSHRAAHQVRIGHQPQDRQGAWIDDPAIAAATCGQDPWVKAVESCPTPRSSRPARMRAAA